MRFYRPSGIYNVCGIIASLGRFSAWQVFNRYPLQRRESYRSNLLTAKGRDLRVTRSTPSKDSDRLKIYERIF